MGGVYPGALTPDIFWEKILSEKRSFPKIDSLFWGTERESTIDKVLSSGREDFLSLRTNLGSEFSDEEKKIIFNRNKLDENFAFLDAMIIDLLKQNNFAHQISKVDSKKLGLILGCCSPGDFVGNLIKTESLSKVKSDIIKLKNEVSPDISLDMISEVEQKIVARMDHLQDKIKDSKKQFLTYELKKRIANYFQCNLGEFLLVDAACASSLAAIDTAIHKLQSKQLDFVFSGGLNAELQFFYYLIFSKMEAMCSRDQFLPFDQSSTGFMMGLGGAIFGLKRLETALADGDEILAVITGNGSSSDGTQTSLFEPSQEGQLLAYQRAYGNDEKIHVDYIEAHGTGTTVGDTIECESIKSFFKQKKILIGSAKTHFGHTIAGAGATSMLKSLLMIKHKLIPQQKLVKTFIDKSDKLQVSIEKPLKLNQETIKIGISSFGFGGTNFHLVLETFTKKSQDKKAEIPTKPPNEIVVIGRSYLTPERNLLKDAYLFLRMPPTSVQQIDEMQVFAIMACFKLIIENRIYLDFADKDKISVLSTSSLIINSIREALIHTYNEITLIDLFEDYKGISQIVNKHNIKVDQDFGVGHLNNIMSGRATNLFNLKGKNYSIDAENNSFCAAVNIAKANLELEDGAFIIITNDEKVDLVQNKKEYLGIKIEMLATKQFALNNFLPILETLGEVEFAP